MLLLLNLLWKQIVNCTNRVIINFMKVVFNFNLFKMLNNFTDLITY